ncbi:hypothetical protein ACH5RR_011989 [Cinchona calisaya]|uniref:Uncharacterized protein n=1 Tax=Cinchona calisaya TaxID=153742 RepID=A0ABD3A824_9GENT
MIQRIWLDLLKVSELTISYHPGKANKVDDALSHKSANGKAPTLVKQMRDFELELSESTERVLAALVLQPTLMERIIEAQGKDEDLVRIQKKVKKGLMPDFNVKDDGSLWICGRLCVPNNKELKNKIMKEAYCSKISIYPRGTKMYRDLKRNF